MNEERRRLLVIGMCILLLLFLYAAWSYFNQPITEPSPTLPEGETLGTQRSENSEPAPVSGTVRAGPSSENQPLLPNELGAVMILEYHRIGHPEGRWQRTPENFRRDLQRLYEQNYRLLSLRDLVTNNITTPAGYTPVVLTFDDATPGQMRYLPPPKEHQLDPNCAVGILVDFASRHPDFGLEATFFLLWSNAFGTPRQAAEKVRHLRALGLDLGNHTWNHVSLRRLSREKAQKEIALSLARAREILPDYPFDLLALPYGAIPSNEAILRRGRYGDTEYTNRAALLVGAKPAPSPNHRDFDPFRLPRIQAIPSELDKWLDYFARHPERRYVSDGDPNTITIRPGDRKVLNEASLEGKRLRVAASVSPPSPGRGAPVCARGIYVTAWSAGTPSRRAELLRLLDETELNAMVIDVKDADGRVGYRSQVLLAQTLGAVQIRIPRVETLMADLWAHRVYPIARLVVFKDNWLPRKKPAWAVKTPTGDLWQDCKGFTWADPYNEEVWKYNVDLALEAVQRGFREIQFDYVRFPSDGRVEDCVFPAADGREPQEVIGDFLAYARKRLEEAGAFISADLFGLTGLVRHDMGIGQIVSAIAEHVDYICPMLYPSHYNPQEYGFPNPNTNPYPIVLFSLRDFIRRIGSRPCRLRPWLQDFTLGFPPYGPEMVRAQIDAVNIAGINEWLLWNPRNRYTRAALLPARQSEGR
ncbi:MAG TPA: hypothetical protein EYP85_10195 [Armatimonadetes bacterium]|nr:hypothetical protein [Armatimonadota bacterium]